MICRDNHCAFPHHVVYEVVEGDNNLRPNWPSAWPCAWAVAATYNRRKAEAIAAWCNKENPVCTYWVAELHHQVGPSVKRGTVLLPRHPANEWAGTPPAHYQQAEYNRYLCLLGLRSETVKKGEETR